MILELKNKRKVYIKQKAQNRFTSFVLAYILIIEFSFSSI